MSLGLGLGLGLAKANLRTRRTLTLTPALTLTLTPTLTLTCTRRAGYAAPLNMPLTGMRIGAVPPPEARGMPNERDHTTASPHSHSSRDGAIASGIAPATAHARCSRSRVAPAEALRCRVHSTTREACSSRSSAC